MACGAVAGDGDSPAVGCVQIGEIVEGLFHPLCRAIETEPLQLPFPLISHGG